eukprot:1942020-Prymnesium_polylepis.2
MKKKKVTGTEAIAATIHVVDVAVERDAEYHGRHEGLLSTFRKKADKIADERTPLMQPDRMHTSTSSKKSPLSRRQSLRVPARWEEVQSEHSSSGTVCVREVGQFRRVVKSAVSRFEAPPVSILRAETQAGTPILSPPRA